MDSFSNGARLMTGIQAAISFGGGLLFYGVVGVVIFFVTSERYVVRLLIETRSANVVHCSDGFDWCLTLVFV